MSDEKSNGNGMVIGLVIAAIVSGGVGLAFVGSQQSTRNEQNSIDQLPALEARLLTLETLANTQQSQISNLRADLLDREAIDDIVSQLNLADTELRDQVNRRLSLEVKEPIYRELEAIQNLIKLLDDDAQENEAQIVTLIEAVARLQAIQEIVSQP